jgi:hypothetical protein
MIGFDPLTLSAAYLLTSMTVAECPAQTAPQVSVQMVTTDNPLVGNQTPEQMASLRSDRDSSAYWHGKWMPGGATLTRGMALKEGIDIEFKTHPAAAGTVCLSVDKVNYTVTFSPTIYLAAGLSDCASNATLAHEKRHVALDETIINNNLPVLQQAIEDYMASRPPQPPVPETLTESLKTELMKKAVEAIKGKWGNLSYQVQQAQGQVDTADDYKRDTAACPGQFPPYAGVKK